MGQTCGRLGAGLHRHRPVPATQRPGWEPTCGSQLSARACATSSPTDVTPSLSQHGGPRETHGSRDQAQQHPQPSLEKGKKPVFGSEARPHKVHQTSSVARPLWSRGSGTTTGDLIHPPALVPSGSVTDSQLNSHRAGNQERDRTEGSNIYPGDFHYQHQPTPSL